MGFTRPTEQVNEAERVVRKHALWRKQVVLSRRVFMKVKACRHGGSNTAPTVGPWRRFPRRPPSQEKKIPSTPRVETGVETE